MNAARPSKMALIGWLALALFNCITVPYIGRGWPPPHDFGMFYTAAQIYLHGTPEKLYDVDVQKQVQQHIYSVPDDQLFKRVLPYNHLPYEVLLYLPLASLSANQAFWVWRLESLALLVLTVWLFAKTFLMRRKVWQLLVVSFAFFPVPFCFLTGQDTFVTLAVIAASLWLLTKEKPVLAGAVLALGLFKFQLVLPIIGIFLLRRSWRVVTGFTASGIAVLAVSFLMVGRQGMTALVRLWVSGENGGVACINPLTMPNIRGLLSCIPGLAPHVATLATFAISVLLLFLAVRQSRFAPSATHFFAMALCFVILVSFHTNLYDLVLLLLPAFVLLENCSSTEVRPWRVMVPLFLLMSPIVYLAALAIFRVALLSILVGGTWGGLVVLARWQPAARSQPKLRNMTISVA